MVSLMDWVCVPENFAAQIPNRGLMRMLKPFRNVEMFFGSEVYVGLLEALGSVYVDR